jgi:subtilisin family serine protease
MVSGCWKRASEGVGHTRKIFVNWQRAFFFLIAISILPLQAFGGQLDAKLDAALVMMAREVGVGTLSKLTNHFGFDLSSSRPTINVLVFASWGASEHLARAGYPIKSEVRVEEGDIISTSVSLDQLYALAALPRVFFVEAVKRYRPTLDRSIPDVRANLVRSRNPDGSFSGTTGKGVIIGIIDSGVDWRHLDFRKPDGTTRIKFLWDPSDDSFQRLGIGSAPPPGGMGTVYTEGQINSALQGGGTIGAQDQLGHGTHVTGVAAGNGVRGGQLLPAGNFVGVAPEADIISVRVFGPDGTFLANNVDLIQAMGFIDQMAATLQQPYVINLSLGTQIGPHDGTSLEEIAIDSLVGPGKPGKAVVVSAGNDGGQLIHTGGAFGPPGSSNNQVVIQVSQLQPNDTLFNFWFSQQDNFTVILDGGGLPPEDITQCNSDTCIASSSPLNSSKELLFITSRAPSFTITITGQSVQNGRFDGWLQGNAAFTSQVDFSRLVAIPGTARNAITVGAYVTKTQWTNIDGQTFGLLTNNLIGELASFSSPGPTRDGRQKPELAAPGRVIASTLTSDAQPGAPGDTSIFSRQLVLSDGMHAISQGTSFSAPHVAGAAALLFERDPTRDALDIRNLLSATAGTDSFTGQVPNVPWGFGKLDVSAALGGTEAAGIVLYFPFAPSGFFGFDSFLYLAGLGFSAPQLVVDTRGLGAGSSSQLTHVDVPALGIAALSSGTGPLNFKCVPQPNLCQLFIHRRDGSTILNFMAMLGIFNSDGHFQFVQPYSFTVP